MTSSQVLAAGIVHGTAAGVRRDGGRRSEGRAPEKFRAREIDAFKKAGAGVIVVDTNVLAGYQTASDKTADRHHRRCPPQLRDEGCSPYVDLEPALAYSQGRAGRWFEDDFRVKFSCSNCCSNCSRGLIRRSRFFIAKTSFDRAPGHQENQRLSPAAPAGLCRFWGSYPASRRSNCWKSCVVSRRVEWSRLRKRSANDTLAVPIAVWWCRCYAATASGAESAAAASAEAAAPVLPGGRQLCGSSCARSRCLSVGSRSNTSFR